MATTFSHRSSRRNLSGSLRDRPRSSDSGFVSLSDRASPRPLESERVLTARELQDQLENPLAVRDALRAKQADIERLKLENSRLRDDNLRLRGEFHELERVFNDTCDSEKLLRTQNARLAQHNDELTAENDRIRYDYKALKAHTSYLVDSIGATGGQVPAAPKVIPTSSSRSSHHKSSVEADKPSKDRQRDRLSRRFDSSKDVKERSSSHSPKASTSASKPTEVYVYSTSADRSHSRRDFATTSTYPNYVVTSQLEKPVYAPTLAEPTYASIPRSNIVTPGQTAYIVDAAPYFHLELPAHKDRTRKR